jgi:succinate-acetate transporter protein
MASADFCFITSRIAARCAVPILPFAVGFNRYRMTASDALGSFWFQCGLTGLSVKSAPLVKQISPSKNIIFPCTTAAFTLFTVPEGFVVMCQLAPQTRPSMQFLFVSSHFCTRASFAQFLAVLHLPSASGYPCSL